MIRKCIAVIVDFSSLSDLCQHNYTNAFFIILGVPRKTDEEKRFGDFSLFDDPSSPYSTFTFTYSHESFDRLSQLMEYNTRRNLPLISDVIAQCLNRKQKEAAQLMSLNCAHPAFKLLPMKTAKGKFRSKRLQRE